MLAQECYNSFQAEHIQLRIVNISDSFMEPWKYTKCFND